MEKVGRGEAKGGLSLKRYAKTFDGSLNDDKRTESTWPFMERGRG